MHHSLGEEELARRHYEIARRELTDSSAAHPGDDAERDSPCRRTREQEREQRDHHARHRRRPQAHGAEHERLEGVGRLRRGPDGEDDDGDADGARAQRGARSGAEVVARDDARATQRGVARHGVSAAAAALHRQAARP